ncbi:MAG: hypothetical protein E3J47_05735 [Candidatus Stahlbacteria bacterium]|nr:MAG: hypothetical protein E3J47_05735 [Candidatus Stahlbacteria bacterium]
MKINKFFYYKDHGILTPCTGRPPNTYKISYVKEQHIIDTKYAIGHGRKKVVTFFEFTKAVEGGFLLSSGKIISEKEYNEAKALLYR